MQAPQTPPDDHAIDLREGLEAILAVSTALSMTTNEDELLNSITSTVCHVLGFGFCSIFLADGDVYRVRSYSGLRTIDFQDAITGYTLSTRAYNDILAVAQSIGSIAWLDGSHELLDRLEAQGSVIPTSPSARSSEWHPRSLLFVPLLDPSGSTLGALNPDDPLDGKIPTRERAILLETMASMASLAIQLNRSRAQAASQVRVLDAERKRLIDLFQRSTAIQREHHLDSVLRTTVQAITAAGGFQRCTVLLLNAETEDLEVRMLSGVSEADEAYLRMRPTPLSIFKAIMQPEMRISRSYLSDHRITPLPEHVREYLSIPTPDPDRDPNLWGPEDTLAIPLLGSKGELLGVISVDEPDNGQFPTLEQIQALEFFTDQAAVAVSETVNREELITLAQTDPLTGMPNRRMLEPLLERLIRSAREAGSSIAVLFLDVDHFKHVNDTFGHAMGDTVLSRVAHALSNRLRSQDVVVRYGGEEFVVGLGGTSMEGALETASSILTLLPKIVVEGAPGLRIEASIGLATALPSEIAQAASTQVIAALLERADKALLSAKAHGRNRVAIADPDHETGTMP